MLLLTGIVAMIMMRTLRRDFNRYNEQVSSTPPLLSSPSLSLAWP